MPPIQQMPPVEQPPMDFMDNNQQMTDNSQMFEPQMGGGEINNQFDTNFDAGVSADEENDPKKYIQQLTGKLSQTLRKYNEDLGQPDVDLNKYVAGMINKQAIEGLSEDDVDEILKKVKSNEPTENGGDNVQDQQPMPQGDNMMGDGMQQMPNESKMTRNRGVLVNELTNDILNGKEDVKPYSKSDTKKSYRTKPFCSPNIER